MVRQCTRVGGGRLHVHSSRVEAGSRVDVGGGMGGSAHGDGVPMGEDGKGLETAGGDVCTTP